MERPYYRLWNDREHKEVSEICLANQLMAAWCSRIAGLKDPFRPPTLTRRLTSISNMNLKATSYGLINGVTPEGKPFDTGLGHSGDHAKNIFFGENLCAAMTFLYYGRRDTGLLIAERLYSAVAVKNNSPWNQRCLLNGETGMPQWGEDYYSNLVIWAFRWRWPASPRSVRQDWPGRKHDWPRERGLTLPGAFTVRYS